MDLTHDERDVLAWYRKAKAKTQEQEMGGDKLVSVLLIGAFTPIAIVSHQMDFIAGVASVKHAATVSTGNGFLVEDNLLSPIE